MTRLACNLCGHTFNDGPHAVCPRCSGRYISPAGEPPHPAPSDAERLAALEETADQLTERVTRLEGLLRKATSAVFALHTGTVAPSGATGDPR